MLLAILSVSAVSAGLFDGLLGGEKAQDNVIEIDNVTFNTTNVSEFKLYNVTEDFGVDWNWYVDENDTGYNVYVCNVSFLNDSGFNQLLKDLEDDMTADSVSSQTIDGIVVYNTSANYGDRIGEVRYEAYVADNDLKSVVDICTPDLNETVKMASTLKFGDK